jgi:hypothetical protein
MSCPSIFFQLIILIIFGEKYTYEVPHYAVFPNLPSLHISSVQIFSSAPCSQTLSVILNHLICRSGEYIQHSILQHCIHNFFFIENHTVEHQQQRLLVNWGITTGLQGPFVPSRFVSPFSCIPYMAALLYSWLAVVMLRQDTSVRGYCVGVGRSVNFAFDSPSPQTYCNMAAETPVWWSHKRRPLLGNCR